MKTLLVVFTALSAASLSGVASATPVDEVRQQVVKFSDLDLSSQPDAAILYQRIKSAAREVCTMRELPPVEIMAQRQRCASQATARAVAEVNAPLVTRQAANGGAMVHDAERVAFVHASQGQPAGHK
jgi:UrcA family protein